MSYDPMKAEVTVTVTKDGHTLTATKALPTDTEFDNTFTPAATSAQFKFTKKLEGKALVADAFSFELLENGQVLQTKKNGADGTIQFDAISYDKEGTHTYTVREVAGTDTDIDYDTMNAEVTVKVTKDATTGILTANVTMPADSEFNNYAVAPVTAQFDFSKVLSGRAGQELHPDPEAVLSGGGAAGRNERRPHRAARRGQNDTGTDHSSSYQVGIY